MKYKKAETENYVSYEGENGCPKAYIYKHKHADGYHFAIAMIKEIGDSEREKHTVPYFAYEHHTDTFKKSIKAALKKLDELNNQDNRD